MAPDPSGTERTAAERLEELMQGALPAELPVDNLEGDALRLTKAVNRFIEFQREVLGFIGPLSRGDLRAAVPAAQNLLASPFKELQSRLVHLPWQAEQVARGDYSQRVDFMGDFSRAFNAMVESLAAKERELRERIEELQGLNRIKDEFLRMATHDLRNPLNVILGYTSVLQRLRVVPEHERLVEEVRHGIAGSVAKMRALVAAIETERVHEKSARP